jgi:hypothetical protein
MGEAHEKGKKREKLLEFGQTKTSNVYVLESKTLYTSKVPMSARVRTGDV